jgi:galactokinase
MHDPAVFRSKHLARYHAEPVVFAAPGRVNLIGEHTDYAEGFVMPAAINFATLAGISPRTDGKIAIYSENYDEEKVFEAASLPAKASQHWSDYRRGPQDSWFQPEHLERCSSGLRAVKLGRHRGGHGAGRSLACRRKLSRPRAGTSLPAR